MLPHKQIESKLQTAVREVLPDADVSAVLVRPCEPKFGDYQANALMSLAKTRKLNSRQLAAVQAVADAVDGKPFVARQMYKKPCLFTVDTVPPEGKSADYKTCGLFSADLK